MRKKSIAIISILIFMCIAIFNFATISHGETANWGGLKWYYEVVDGEAVNVYVYGGNLYDTVTIPSSLGGYPVTSILGPTESGRTYSIFGKTNDTRGYSLKVTTVIIPDTVTSIGEYAFYGCTGIKNIDLPENIENIEKYAFNNTGLETITIPNSVKTIYRNSFNGMKDIYVDNLKEDVEIKDITYTYTNSPYIHYKNCKHNITTNVLDGIKIINEQTGEEIKSSDFECKNSISLKIQKDDTYNYENLAIFIESESDYLGKDNTIEKINLEDLQSYTFNSLTRNKKIYVQNIKDGFDLSLRQYISKINNKEIKKERTPNVKIVNGKIQYQHTKTALYPQKGDKIVYNIRVYNEGTIAGTANEITQYLPEGLDFDKNSAINIKYRWNVSEDGRKVTTQYLSPLTIEAYKGINDISYQELSIECIVNTEKTDELKRLVNIAEITQSSSLDTDSVSGNVTLPIDSNYMKAESENSNEISYIVGTEDDNDFENIIVSNSIPTKYSLKINKIDEIDNELLNGATFELLNENEEIIQTGVTSNNGTLDFGMMETKGEGKDIYYIKETNSPEGYKNKIKYLIKVEVIKKLDDEDELKTSINCDLTDIDIDTSKYKIIPIYTKEQLQKIGSNEDVLIEQENQIYKFDDTKVYTLKNDIDLEAKNWTPINGKNIMINGNGYKILNLKIESNDQNTKKFGLFGEFSGTIENLTIENVDIDITKYVDESSENVEETEETIDSVGAIIGYSQNAILKNCKVTGTIDSQLRNIGGLVGHTKSKTILVLRDCINETTITGESHNIGGLLGCGLGPVKVNNCINKGNISAKSYNAGGIIGFIRPEGYTPLLVSANYDSTNQIVSMAVKNERTSGQYSIKIKKIDSQSSTLLDGAIFQVLDKNKNIISGYENIKANEGILDLGTIEVDSLGTDIYYIKEVQAPLGYSKISNDYIKLNIVKKWDKTKEAYYIEQNIEIISDQEFENITPKNDDNSSSKTGVKYDELQDNVQWNINELEINNSSNEASISNEYEYTNTAGITGASEGRTIINNCKNIKEVTAQSKNAKTAGIIASIIKQEDANVAQVTGCTNLSEITGTSNNNEGQVAGIIAYSKLDIEITKNRNEANIIARNSNSAGIIGNGVGNITIDNCSNIADVTSLENNGNSSGIFAQNYFGVWNQTGNIIISNCENTGNIVGVEHTAGILALTSSSSVKIINCTNNSEIKAGQKGKAVSGILGNALTENVLVQDCTINNTKITNESKDYYAQTAGILAGVCYVSTQTNVNVINCQTLSSTIIANANSASGIVGISFNISEPHNINIKNCKTVKTDITNEATIGSNTAGILAEGVVAKENIVNIENCEVSGGSITTKGGNIGGICNLAYADGNGDTLIKDCNVSQVQITHQNASASLSSNCGGIAGVINDDLAIIENCEVTDSNITATGVQNVSGMVGFTWFRTFFKNCNVIKTNISATSYLQNSTIAGIMAMPYGGAKFENCQVTNLDIQGTSQQAAGIVTNATHDRYRSEHTDEKIIHIKESIVDSININVNEIANNYNYSAIGGIAAGTANTADYGITNCSFTNSTITTDMMAAGGIIGTAWNNSDINNCNVEHVNIISNYIKNSGVSGAVGGVIGAAQNIEPLNNCIIKDLTIDSKQAAAGGLIGSGVSSFEANNCEIEQLNLTNQNSIGANYSTTPSGRTVGGIVGTVEQNFTLNNSILNQITVNATMTNQNSMTHAGGVAAVVGEAITFNNNTITNITVTNETKTGQSAGLVALQINYYDFVIEDMPKFNNIKVNGNSIAGAIAAQSQKTSINKLLANEITITSGDTLGGLVGICFGEFNISNSSINKVNASASSGTSYTAVGGIIGCSQSSILVTQNSIENLTITNGTEGGAGGIVGTQIGYLTISNISKYNTINVTGKGNAGSFAGFVTGTAVNDITCTDITVNAKQSTGGLIGMVYYGGDAIINNVTVNSSKGKENIITGSGQHNGILIGFSNNLTTKGTLNITNTTLNAQNGQTAGLVGQVYNYNEAKDITLENVKILGGQYAGGLVGMVETQGPITVDNITLNNVSVSSSQNAGGIFGIACNPSFSNITSNKLSVSSNLNTGGLVGITTTKEKTNITDSNFSNLQINGSSNAGGLIAISVNPRVTNVTITNMQITNNGTYSTGGLIGIATKTSNLMSDQTATSSAEFTGITINKTENGTNKIIGGSSNTGILLGFGTLTTDNINISDVTVDGTNSQAAGIIGTINTGSSIKNITASNVNITTANRGGIIAGVSLSNIDQCSVDKSTITGLGNGDFGGIVGNMPVGTTVLSNCNVSESKLTAAAGHIGGIIGFASNTISDCTASDVIITGTSANGVGGIVGHGSNFTGTDTYVKKCNVIDSTISGNSQVGGISGGAIVKIENCFVGGKENETLEEGTYAVTITGNDAVGGIIGDPGIVYSDGQSMITMTGTNISNSLIKGTTNLDYLIGIHGRFSTSYSGTQGETITLSNYTDCKTEIK